MSSKSFIIFFLQAFIAQVVFSQCIHPCGECSQAVYGPSVGPSSCDLLGTNGLAYGGRLGFGTDGFANGYIGTGLNAISIEASHGGGFPVQSGSNIAPSGLSVASENAYKGDLYVIGELPFLSVVALEGVTPSGGAGIVHHGCGNGVTAITREIGNDAGALGIGSAGIGVGSVGYGAAIGAIPVGGVCLGRAESHPCGCGLY